MLGYQFSIGRSKFWDISRATIDEALAFPCCEYPAMWYVARRVLHSSSASIFGSFSHTSKTLSTQDDLSAEVSTTPPREAFMSVAPLGMISKISLLIK